MPVSASDTINIALEHTKVQLLRPFRFGQWLRLALVGLLAGELGSSGGCNFHANLSAQRPPDHRTETLVPWPSQVPPWIAEHPWETVWLVIAGVVLFMAVTVLFLYIGSRMRFVLFDSVIARECHVRAGWRRRKEEGDRLFVWQVVLSLISFLAVLFLICASFGAVWALGWLAKPGDHLWQLVLAGLLAILTLIAVGIVFALIHVLTKDFVVPQMALEPISALEGWRRLLLWMRQETVGYAAYIGMKIVLAIGASILIGIISIVVVLFVVLPVGGAGFLAILAAKTAGWTWNVYTISAAAVVGLAVLAMLIFLISLINVPAIVFFPAYSIYFLAARYQPLAQALWPAVVKQGSSPPMEPPISPLREPGT